MEDLCKMTEEIISFSEYKKENPNRLTKDQFTALQQEIIEPQKETISDEYLDFKFWRQRIPCRQDWFAANLQNEVLPEKQLHILEVGCGRYAKLSVLLAKMGYKLTCMDPKAEPIEVAKIKVRKEEFHYKKTDLTTYDFVVAQEPCEATEHIVRACSLQKVPFLIVLCGVPHKLISGKMPADVYQWYNYLADIDAEHTKLFVQKLYPRINTAIIKGVF